MFLQKHCTGRHRRNLRSLIAVSYTHPHFFLDLFILNRIIARVMREVHHKWHVPQLLMTPRNTAFIVFPKLRPAYATTASTQSRRQPYQTTNQHVSDMDDTSAKVQISCSASPPISPRYLRQQYTHIITTSPHERSTTSHPAAQRNPHAPHSPTLAFPSNISHHHTPHLSFLFLPFLASRPLTSLPNPFLSPSPSLHHIANLLPPTPSINL